MAIESSIKADETVEAPIKAFIAYGLQVYTYQDEDYILADDDDQADEAAAEYIRESLWAFRAPFIVKHIPGGPDWSTQAIKALEEMQGKLCEGANPIIEAMLGANLDAFIDDAIESDGRGRFLSSYDGLERDGEEVYEGWQGKLVYRI